MLKYNPILVEKPRQWMHCSKIRVGMRRVCALLLACMLLLPAAPAGAFWPFTSPAALEAQTPEALETREDSVLRVKLASLDAPMALGLTLCGQYTVDGDKGFRFARDTQLSVAVDGKNLLLSVGGLTIDMGVSVLFKRHAVPEGEQNGLLIHENKYNTLYQGDLLLTNEDGAISAVVYIDVDDYLYGVVPFEMSDSFPLEALKAQAVAARTYALSRRAANQQRAYDVVDTTADQVFRGLNPDYENAIRAVDETRYVVGRYQDEYATCYFSASNGGQTAMPGEIWGYSGDYGYLDVRDDPYDLANTQSVVKRLTVGSQTPDIDAGILKRLKDGLRDQLGALGLSTDPADIHYIGIKRIEPTAPKFEGGNRMFTKLRCYLVVSVNGDDEAGLPQASLPEPGLYVDLDFYNDLKPNFGLKINAANCELVSVKANYPEGEGEVQPDSMPVSFSIESRRFGHGVGMSQRGAQQMAGQEGKTYIEILGFYYPGMQLRQMAFQTPPLTEIEALPASVGYARARPTPKPTPAPLPPLQSGESYAKVNLSSKGSTLNVREQPNTDAKVLDVLMNGQMLIVVRAMDEEWAEIKTAETQGFVSRAYLADTK